MNPEILSFEYWSPKDFVLTPISPPINKISSHKYSRAIKFGGLRYEKLKKNNKCGCVSYVCARAVCVCT